MKKILTLAYLLVGLTIASFAQVNHAMVTDPAEKAKGLQKQLKLTSAQTEKITAIYKESAEKFEKIKVKDNGNTNKMLVEIAPLRAATIKKIKNVLTPSQTVKYDNLVKESKTQGINGGWSDGWSATSEN